VVIVTTFLAGLVVLLIAEIYAVVAVANEVGVVNTVLLLLAFSFAGVWLTKRVGLSVLTRIRRQVAAQQVPGNELIDAGLVLVAGLFLIVPGFVSDGIGLLLLFPPTRSLVRAMIRRRFRVRVLRLGPATGGDVIDV
jgi:UPF0716 protein FxsA